MKKEGRKERRQNRREDPRGPFINLSTFIDNYCASAISLGCEWNNYQDREREDIPFLKNLTYNEEANIRQNKEIKVAVNATQPSKQSGMKRIQ